jgi:hypothetical protein
MNPAFIEDDPEDDLVGDANVHRPATHGPKGRLWKQGKILSQQHRLVASKQESRISFRTLMDALLDDTKYYQAA